MEDISVGDYVRTKNGYICQILRTTYSKYLSRNKEFCYEVDRPINVNMELFDEDIAKHSPNIIDLIEVGDYVNGEKVFATNKRINDNGEKVILTENYDEWTDNGVTSNKHIKSIVTKEQFKSVSYEV